MSVLISAVRAAHLRWQDMTVAVQVLVLTAALEILKRRRALPDLVAFFTPTHTRSKRYIEDYRRLVAVTNMILSRIYGRDFCMPRSFVLLYMMRSWGYDVEIHFGVMRLDGVLKGHAWLEMNGIPISEGKDPRGAYTPVCSFPSPIHPKTSEVAA